MAVDTEQYIEQQERIRAQVEDRYGCEHEQREVRQRTLANGVTVLVSQCLRCGVMQNVAKDKVPYPVRLRAKPADLELRDRFQQERFAYSRMLYEEARNAERQERTEAYDVYLRSEAWRRKARRVLRRDQGICQSCLEAPATQVHHLTYAHIGNEPLFDLVSVCADCHRNILHPEKGDEA